MSLGVRACETGGVSPRRCRFGTGERERERDRSREDLRERNEPIGERDREREGDFLCFLRGGGLEVPTLEGSRLCQLQMR